MLTSARSTMRTCRTYLRQHFWRPSQRRYLRVHVCRFLECWWNATWLYFGSVAVLAAFLSDSVKGEPTVILLSIAMIWVVRNLKNDRGISIAVGVLGMFAALLAIPQKAEIGATTVALWKFFGILISVAAFTSIVFVLLWFYTSGSRRQRQRERRRRMARRRRR